MEARPGPPQKRNKERSIKVLLFVAAVLSGVGGMGGYLFYVAFRHHKEDPIETRYYDVDYARNNLTGNGHNNTREISRDTITRFPSAFAYIP